MSACMLGFPNRVDSGTLSNGNWVSTLPLRNLQNRVLGKVARTVDAATGSTKFDLDLGIERIVRVLSLINHNISLEGQYRIRGAADAGFATVLVDTGVVDAWSPIYVPAELEWEDLNFWTGLPSADDISGYTTNLCTILPVNTVARYWRVEIFDSANAAGYVQLGRFFIGPVWQPTLNMSIGSASLGWETNTSVQEAIGGAEYFQERTPYRVQKFTLDLLTQDAAFSNAFEIQRRAGVSSEIMWVHDPADTVQATRRRFLSRIRTLSPIEYPYALNNSTAFELKELL